MSPIALVVDDNPMNRTLAEAFLRRLGWRCAQAADTTDAFDRLLRERFDAVLLDFRLPGMDGEQACAVIRSIPGLERLPLVAYTAHAMPEERARLRAVGFDALLIKPVSFTEFAAAFATIADRAQPGARAA